MAAAVGGCIARAWRLFDVRFTRHPQLWALLALSAAVDVNVFAHAPAPDIRLTLFGAAGWLFGRTFALFEVWQVHRRMPLLRAGRPSPCSSGSRTTSETRR